MFNHITLLICNRNNSVVQLKLKKKKADQISFLGDVIAFILAITHLCLLRVELITGKDKLLFLSLLQLGWYWIRMTWYMLIALWETHSPVKIDRTISADIKPSPEFAQGLQMLLPQNKFPYKQIRRMVVWCSHRGYQFISPQMCHCFDFLSLAHPGWFAVHFLIERSLTRPTGWQQKP